MLKRSVVPLLFPLMILFASGCDDIKVHYDKTVDFSAYQTFAWKVTDPEDKHLLERDYPEAAQRLKTAVSRELTGRGLKATEAGDADLIVSYQVGLDVERAGRRTDLTAAGNEAVVPVWGGGAGAASYQDPIKDVTLIYHLEDRRQGKLVWQGQFSKKFRNPSDLETADIQKTINRLFRKFPR